MIGQTISHYRVVGKLGAGGMGVVYKAVDLELQRTVALKFLPDEAVGVARSRERFMREARAASQLDHVNIGTIFAVEQTPEGHVFIAMAHYDGETLGAAIRRGPLGVVTAVDYCTQMARGLAEAHRRGIVHRDVKPSNVLIAPGGVLKLVDFGLAKLADVTRITRSGSRLGTPSYMSPEQAQGLAVDHRGDIWALGVILYEMLSGQVPFQADSVPATLYKIVHSAAPDLDRVEPELRDVVRKAIAKDPAVRFQSMGEMLVALGASDSAAGRLDLLGSRETTREMPSAVPPATRRPRLARVSGMVLAGGGALILALAAFLVPGSPLRTTERPDAADRPSGAPTFLSAPAAYERYLEGLPALERWDKGDNLAQAVASFEEAARLDPAFALAHARLSDALRIQSILDRDPELARRALGEATRAAELDADLPAVQVSLGRAHARLGDHELAHESLQRALKLDALNVDALTAISGVYAKLGRPADAEASLRRAVDVQPDSWAVHDSLASFYYRRHEYGKAIRHWRRVLEITPDNAAAYTNLGAAFSDSGQPAEAQTMYERALALKPNFTAFMNLGTILYLAGRYEDAAEKYEKALQLNEADYLAWGNLAAAHARIPGLEAKAREAFEKAAALAEDALARSPRDPYVNSDLGLYYAHLGEAERATRRLKAALAIAPDDPEIHAWAAETREVLGERDDALDLVRRALELGYSQEKLRRNPQLEELCRDPRFPG
jgi:serine/threonine-protein kinase